MFHVDNPTGVPVMPPLAPVTSNTPLFFTEGGNGLSPTYPGPDWFNIVQSELLNILAAANIPSNKNQQDQVLTALKKIFAEKTGTLGALASLTGAKDKLPYFTGADAATLTDLTPVGRDILASATKAAVLEYLGLGNTKYGAPLIGQLIEWPLQKMPHEIWPDMGQEYIPYRAQSFDPVKYPLLSQLHPTNVLPADMRGYGVRGWDNARGVDTGRALMSAQSSGAPNLTGTVQNVVGILGAGSTGAALGWTPGGVASTAKAGTDSGVISIVMDASKSSKEYQSITEVRSKNVAWNMIVRAK
ncbi:hypothetical protein STW0522KLE44_42460 [Klebsiella sp. STW0522-44]|nr:hypothetical protein STW0522KLE44_42460 [Klebsiella sp. STW0522-44]